MSPGYDVTRLSTVSRNKSVEGRDYADYHLSRFAAYLVAVNGDPDKQFY